MLGQRAAVGAALLEQRRGKAVDGPEVELGEGGDPLTLAPGQEDPVENTALDGLGGPGREAPGGAVAQVVVDKALRRRRFAAGHDVDSHRVALRMTRSVQNNHATIRCRRGHLDHMPG